MRDTPVLIVLSLVISILCPGCSKDFSPKAPFEPQLVAYSVLYTDSPQQFVRIYSTYDVSGYDPYGNHTDGAIAGATVSVSGPWGPVAFRDTLLPRPDTSRYKTPILAYVSDWKPKPGEAYTLNVNAGDLGSTQSTVAVPPLSSSHYWIPTDPTIALDFPDTSTISPYVAAAFKVSPSVKSTSQQLYILYSVQRGDTPPEDKAAQLLGQNVAVAGSEYVSVACSRVNIAAMIHSIANKNASGKLTFKRIVFRLQQMEQHWTDYYNIVRLSQDTRSTRFDQPDITNMSSGYGLFGACSVDTLYHDYPSDFRFNH